MRTPAVAVQGSIEAAFLQRRVSRRAILGTLPACAILGSAGLIVSGACAQPDPQARGLRSSSFGSFAAAVAAWSKVGGTLTVDMDHSESAPVTMMCTSGQAYHLTSDGPRTISYAGPHHHWLFQIYSPGRNPFRIDGGLTFDGRNRCSLPFYARFDDVDGAARRSFQVDGLSARNARMRRGISRIDGSRTDLYGATALLFHGGFDRLELRHVRAYDVSREAGVGVPGSQGCIGIAVIATMGTTKSARHITVQDFDIARIDSDDPPGSRERIDIDGLSIFQSAEPESSRPLVQRGRIRNAAGRAIKVYAPGGGGGVTRKIEVHRSVHGSTGGSNDIAHQHGEGRIEDVVFYYSGAAHSQPTVPIGLSATPLPASRFPAIQGIIRNVTIHDTTGRDKLALVSIYNTQRDTWPRAFALSGIIDSGTSRFLLLPGSMGRDADVTASIEDSALRLTAALIGTDEDVRRLAVRARRLANQTMSAVPVKADYDGRAAPADHVRLIKGERVSGIQ